MSSPVLASIDHEILAALHHRGEVFERHVGAGAGIVEPPVGVFLDDDRLFLVFCHVITRSPAPGREHNRISGAAGQPFCGGAAEHEGTAASLAESAEKRQFSGEFCAGRAVVDSATRGLLRMRQCQKPPLPAPTVRGVSGMKDDIVIVSAARTPVGAFNGAFANLPAHELGKAAIKAALERAGVEGGRVSEVIMGQILTAGQGQNPARQASIAAGIPVESPAWGVNQLCGSGLRAVALGYQAILNGDSEIVVAGGQESMSMAPHCQHLRNGVKMGAFEMVDTMIKDGLWDAFNGYHMGNTAENVAKQWQITRQQQDEFAVNSQNKAEAAMKAGRFKDEIVPVTIKSRKGDIVVDTDEYPKAGVTLEVDRQAAPGLRQGRHRDGGQRLRHQ